MSEVKVWKEIVWSSTYIRNHQFYIQLVTTRNRAWRKPRHELWLGENYHTFLISAMHHSPIKHFVLVIYVFSLATCKQRTVLLRQLSKQRAMLVSLIEHYNGLVDQFVPEIDRAATRISENEINDGIFPWTSQTGLQGTIFASLRTLLLAFRPSWFPIALI